MVDRQWYACAHTPCTLESITRCNLDVGQLRLWDERVVDALVLAYSGAGINLAAQLLAIGCVGWSYACITVNGSPSPHGGSRNFAGLHRSIRGGRVVAVVARLRRARLLATCGSQCSDDSRHLLGTLDSCRHHACAWYPRVPQPSGTACNRLSCHSKTMCTAATAGTRCSTSRRHTAVMKDIQPCTYTCIDPGCCAGNAREGHSAQKTSQRGMRTYPELL